MLPESLLFDRDEIVNRGEYELEHNHLYLEEPPNWFTKFFFGSELTSSNTYNMARVVAESVVMRFEQRLLKWIDERIDAKLQQHREEDHSACR
jgi:hypothetical protein